MIFYLIQSDIEHKSTELSGNFNVKNKNEYTQNAALKNLHADIRKI